MEEVFFWFLICGSGLGLVFLVQDLYARWASHQTRRSIEKAYRE